MKSYADKEPKRAPKITEEQQNTAAVQQKTAGSCPAEGSIAQLQAMVRNSRQAMQLKEMKALMQAGKRQAQAKDTAQLAGPLDEDELQFKSKEAVQKKGPLDEEELQFKAKDTAQLAGPLDEEELQFKSKEAVQKKGPLDEEELQFKAKDTAQLAGPLDEDELQFKSKEAVQKKGPLDEEELQFKAEEPVQKQENKTGLPDDLKAGVENLSGMAMDDVRVHYNSGKPAQLNAYAYTQGTEIHVAPGQEKHLPHEAWHVVQQKQGRVQPTVQMAGYGWVNVDAGIEGEAQICGIAVSNQGTSQGKTVQGGLKDVGSKNRENLQKSPPRDESIAVKPSRIPSRHHPIQRATFGRLVKTEDSKEHKARYVYEYKHGDQVTKDMYDEKQKKLDEIGGKIQEKATRKNVGPHVAVSFTAGKIYVAMNRYSDLGTSSRGGKYTNEQLREEAKGVIIGFLKEDETDDGTLRKWKQKYAKAINNIEIASPEKDSSDWKEPGKEGRQRHAEQFIAEKLKQAAKPSPGHYKKADGTQKELPIGWRKVVRIGGKFPDCPHCHFRHFGKPFLVENKISYHSEDGKSHEEVEKKRLRIEFQGDENSTSQHLMDQGKVLLTSGMHAQAAGGVYDTYSDYVTKNEIEPISNTQPQGHPLRLRSSSLSRILSMDVDTSGSKKRTREDNSDDRDDKKKISKTKR